MSNGASTWLAALAVLGGGCALNGADGVSADAELAPRSALRVLLHDAPTDEVEEVWVEVASVRVHGDGGWSVVNDERRAFDLLALQDGVAAELGLAELPPGDYGQIRLDVADSWVIAGGERQPLRIPSGAQSGLKIEHGFSLPECGTLTITLDWDAGAHLHHNQGQGFMLRPVIEVESESIDEGDCDGAIDDHVDDAALFHVASDDLELYTLGDGNLLSYGDGAGTVVAPDGTLVDATFPDPGHRVALWVAPDGESRPDLVTGAYDGLVALAATGEVAWTWQSPCCNAARIPAAVDPATGQVYLPGNQRVFQRDGRTGAGRGATSSHGDYIGFIALAPDRIWKAGTQGRVTLYDRGDDSLFGARARFSLIADRVPLRPPALASDLTAVFSAGGGPYTADDQPGDLFRVLDDRSVAWRIEAGAVTPPVIGPGDVIYVGVAPSAGVFEVRAYSLDGAELWSAPLAEQPSDLAVGDDGLVYVAAGSELLGLDRLTGEETLRYHGLSSAAQLLLHQGRAYVSDAGDGAIYALPVPATGYDPAAPWPVRFHDNQRTSSL